MVLPAASSPPVQTSAGARHHDPLLHARAAEEARVGAWACAAFSLAAAAAAFLVPERPAGVWISVAVALAAAALALVRATRASDRLAHRLPALAGANALVGVALFAMPLVLGMTGRFVLFPIYFGLMTATFSAAAFSLSLDARHAAEASRAKAARPRDGPTRARPGA